MTDLMMPGMNGSQLARAIREVRPDMRVLFMSGYTDASIVDRGEMDPGVPFVQKPFSVADLAAKIAEALAGTTSPVSHE